jgi:hypothetical protein
MEIKDNKVTTSNQVIVAMAKLAEQYRQDLDNLDVLTGTDRGLTDEIHMVIADENNGKYAILLMHGQVREWEMNANAR